MNSSEYYKAKIDYYNQIIGQISSLSGLFSNCNDEFLKGEKYLDNVILSKKRLDKNKLSQMSSKINSLSGKLLLITNECREKIKIYENLYRVAKARENMLYQQNKQDMM